MRTPQKFEKNPFRFDVSDWSSNVKSKNIFLYVWPSHNTYVNITYNFGIFWSILINIETRKKYKNKIGKTQNSGLVVDIWWTRYINWDHHSLVRVKNINTMFLFFMPANSFFFVHEFSTNIAWNFMPMHIHHMTSMTCNVFEFCTTDVTWISFDIRMC